MFAEVEAKVAKQLRETRLVDRAQTIEFINTGREFAIFNVGQPGMRDVVLLDSFLTWRYPD